MQVKDLMTAEIVSVKPTTPVSEVAELLHSRNLSGVPVMTDSGTAVGMVTAKELFSADSKVYVPQYIQLLQDTNFIVGRKQPLPAVAKKIINTTVADIMNQDIHLIDPQASVTELAQRFVSESANPVLVGTSDNDIRGIVSRTDLIKLVIDHPLISSSLSSTYYRPVDNDLNQVTQNIQTSFALVAKAKINLWFTLTALLFVVGFVAGIIYVADPQILKLF